MTCAAVGSRTLDFLRKWRTPYPLGQAHRVPDCLYISICDQCITLQQLRIFYKFGTLKIFYSSTRPCYLVCRGWSGGAMVLGKLPVPGRPTNLDYSSAKAYCACSGCGWGSFRHFFSRLSFLFSYSLSLGDGPI